MKAYQRWSGAAAVAAMIAVPVTVFVQSDQRQPAGRGWTTVMGDLANRYSTLDQITTENVSQLGGVWMSERLVPPANSRSMAVVQDGMMFFTAPPNVMKMDARTGEIAWRFEAGGAARMGNPDREGVAVAEGLVFVGLSDSRVIALREDTGELVWNRYVGDEARDKGQGIAGAPLYAGGLVTVGLSADNGWRGQVVALDATTGREVWRWFAVPAPGEPGSETWPETAQWQFGGGALWLTGVADEEAGLVYYVTGNGVPQLSGEDREGDNLYVCSVVALDMETGELRWHFQTIRHDIWEADMSISPVLYDAQLDGRTVKAIGAIRPDGYVFTFDRLTGEPLTEIEERPAPQDAFQKTAATQPFPAGAEGVLPDCDWWRGTQTLPEGFEIGCYYQAVSTDRPNVLMPYYGMRVAPMSYSQQTGYFYAVGERSIRWLRRADDGYFFTTAFSSRVPGINRYKTGVMAAIDGRTHEIVWRKDFPLPTGRPSGVMTTAGGLMFHAEPDGTFNAYDAATGERLWQFQTGAPAGGPAFTYELDGQQYIGLVTSMNVWAFTLGGTLAQQAPPPQPGEPALFAGPIRETSQIETAAVQRDMAFTGTRYMTDEYQFNPYRTKVSVGSRVTWRNNGTMVHSAVAEDGSWSTGPIDPAGVAGVTFDRPGTYTYICRQHPWAYAQIIVE
jgi:glucose dehydrogenase/plastocyanin